MPKLVALIAGCLVAASARADEVRIDIVFSNGFDPLPTATVYRIGRIALRDPHVSYSLGFCLDVTDTLNQQLQDQLDADADGNGFYDASPLAIMKPYAEDGAAHLFESEDGDCTTASPSHCTPGTVPPVARWYASFDVSPPTVCLGPLPGTTSGYTPPVPAPGGQCFATSALDTTLPLGTLAVPLWDTQFAAPWPALGGSTSGGLLRGFLREADADAIDVDLNGQSVPLSRLLPDGNGSCATNVPNGLDSDRDEPGWWMYLEYRLDAVSSSGF
ncbi:MAG TPA: hypothetical protein VKB52_01605 [Rhodanobacteraceae bacterium]|nr:hypothetical protein [Rhodanobacteraceae bacterium]